MALPSIRSRLSLGPVDPLEAASVPVAVAPFGYLLGGLFVSHVVPSETTAVWLTTTGLASLVLFALAARG